MSQYSAIKAATNAYIKTNGRQEITGAILNAVMIATIDSLGKFYQFAGVAVPATDPGTLDQNVAYIAGTAGTYTHLGGFTLVAGEVAVIKFDGEWHKETICNVPSKVSDLNNDLGFITAAVSGLLNYYDKDEVDSLISSLSRQSYIVAWDGSSTPVVSQIPQGVSVTYNGNTYTGTLAPSASTANKIYLVSNGAGYDEYITTENSGVYSWIPIGTTSIDLSGYATIADIDAVAEGQKMEDVNNLFSVTKKSGFINSSGTMVSDTTYNSCQLPIENGKTYAVHPQLRTQAGANQPATRVFRVVGTTYTQVWYTIQGGGKVVYTCPDDGNDYVLQLASPTPGDTIGTPRIYLVNEVKDVVSDIDNFLYLPNLWEVTKYRGFVDGSGSWTTNANYNSCQLYDVIPGHTYAVRMQLVGSGVGNYLRVYKMGSGSTKTQVYNKQQNGGIIFYTIPNDGDSYMLQVATRANPSDYPDDGPDPEIYDVTDNIPFRLGKYNRLKVLFIGNSHARDAFSYMPAIIETIDRGIDVTIGILYKGGCTLAEHYSYILNGTPYEAYDKYTTNYGKWVTTTDSSETTCDAALADEEWDIIVLQQRSVLSGDYSTYQPYANDILSMLFGKLKHAVQIGFNMTYAVADTYSEQPDEDSDAQYANIASATQQLIRDTPFQFVIPTATAIQNARQTSLKSLGTFGDMTYDGLHIQEGIPCITAAYCATLKFLEILGMKNIGIFSSIFRPSDNWVTSENVPQKHGSCTGVSTENNFLLAQRCAMAAINFPFEITQ